MTTTTILVGLFLFVGAFFIADIAYLIIADIKDDLER